MRAGRGLVIHFLDGARRDRLLAELQARMNVPIEPDGSARAVIRTDAAGPLLYEQVSQALCAVDAVWELHAVLYYEHDD
jgi:hypothetical protein